MRSQPTDRVGSPRSEDVAKILSESFPAQGTSKERPAYRAATSSVKLLQQLGRQGLVEVFGHEAEALVVGERALFSGRRCHDASGGYPVARYQDFFAGFRAPNERREVRLCLTDACAFHSSRILA